MADSGLIELIRLCKRRQENKTARILERAIKKEADSANRIRALRLAYLRAQSKVRWVLQNTLIDEYRHFAKANSHLLASRPESWKENDLPVFVWKWLFLNDFRPSNEEIVWVFSDPEAEELFVTAVQILGAFVRVSDFALDALRSWEISGSVFSAHARLPWWKKTGFVLADIFNSISRIFIPAPYRGIPSATGGLFQDLWKNPERVLSEAEVELLKSRGLYESYLRQKEVLKQHPIWRRIRLSLNYLATAARYASVIAAVNLGIQQARYGIISAQEYRTNPIYRIQDDEVRIITDVVPFPHLAIQIGDQIYSYGQTHVSSSTLFEYLQLREVTQAQEPEEEQVSTITNSFQVDDLMRWTRLNRLPRSVQIITLKVTPDERDSLKRYFELQVGKRYQNTTFVNDCATMVVRGLEAHSSINFCGFSQLIDASPSQLTMNFAAMKVFNPSRVGEIYLVYTDDEAIGLGHSIRNAYINIVESNLFIEYFFLNQLHRLFVDIRYSEEELHNIDPELLEVIKQIEEDTVERWAQETQIRLYEIKIKRIKSEGESYAGQIAELSQDINSYFHEKIRIVRETIENPETNRNDLIAANAALEWLEKKREDLLKDLRK